MIRSFMRFNRFFTKVIAPVGKEDMNLSKLKIPAQVQKTPHVSSSGILESLNLSNPALQTLEEPGVINSLKEKLSN